MTRHAAAIAGAALIGGLIVAAMPAVAPSRADDAHAMPGAAAPEFKSTDIDGRTVKLSDYRGKPVILEWTNDGCPFVGKHYGSGNMQALQRRFTAAGDIWLTIASSAPGDEGYATPATARADIARWHAAPSDYLLDPAGVVGHLYFAKATPHMVVIAANGTVAYIGAIDDTPSTDPADVKTAKNYVVAALEQLAGGQAVTVPATDDYGCSVKYRTN